ncbi:MAG: HAD family hydrolase [Syntrophorhabdaceae bacterium]
MGDRIAAARVTCAIALFDFGGVLAEEGFQNGLRAIARSHGLNEDEFFIMAREIIYETGYVTGHCSEDVYWRTIRERTGIVDTDENLRNEILTRFIPRPFMFDVVRKIRASGVMVVILSDQTNWLDELDARYNFSSNFDAVFNSFHLGKSKADGSQFSDIMARLGGEPGQALFVDDDEAHCARAQKVGLNAIHYAGREMFFKDLAHYFPELIE